MNKVLTSAASLLALSAQQSYASTTYYFYQPGWTSGGIISGSFTGSDNNSDGLIDSFEEEITNFTVSMTGSSIATHNTSWNQTNIWGIVYDINTDKFLGNDGEGGGEGFAMFAGENNNFLNYYSGYGPNFQLGGNLYSGPDNGDPNDRTGWTSVDETPLAIMIDTTAITSASYIAAANDLGLPSSSIPEPSTYGLIGIAALGLAFAARHRKIKKA
jgi:hypothetical protein